MGVKSAIVVLNGIEHKTCCHCGGCKPLSDFFNCKFTTSGKSSWCKQCDKERNSGAGRIFQKKEHNRRSYNKHKDEISIHRAEKRREDPALVSRHHRLYYFRHKLDPRFHLRTTVSSSIRKAIGNKGGNGCWGILGYSETDLRKHLERQFKPGMSWDNYGSCWHIDHKIPVSAFNFRDSRDIDFKRCWSLDNLQPLFAVDNLRKSKKVDFPFQPALSLAV